MERMIFQKALVIVAFLCVATVATAQNINTNPYWPGTITLNDGTVKDGWIKVPNSSKENNISFMPTFKDPIELVKRDDIATITVTSEQDHTYYYENIPIVITIKGNSSGGSSLLLVAGRNNYVTFYVESQKYRVDTKKGEIYLFYRYVQGYDFPTLAYYIRKKDREKANLLHITGHLGGLKKGANYHLTEDPALLKRINDKELTADDLPEIITTYLATTEKLAPSTDVNK